MVATSIVLILVVLVGSVFRQASSAWDSGYARAEGGMVVRGVLGAIQRELSRAVDGRHFPGAWPAAYRDDPVYVSDNGKTLAFIRPEFDYIPPDTASAAQTEEAVEKNKEQYILVTYKIGTRKVTRDQEKLVWDNDQKNWSKEDYKSDDIYQDDDRHGYGFESDFEFLWNPLNEEPELDELRDETGEFKTGYFWTVPTVSIRVTFARTGKYGGLRVRSVGPDGKPDTDDDIVIR